GLCGIPVDREQFHRPDGDSVIASVAGEGEIGEVGLGVGCQPVVGSQGGPEFVGRCPCAVATLVGVDIVVVELADIGVDGGVIAIGIVIVTDRGYEVGVPAVHQVGDGCLESAAVAVVADDGKGGRQDAALALLGEQRMGGGPRPPGAP